MQSDWKQIYKLTSERTKVDEQIYKDVGNFVFSELYANLKKPKSLILKLKGVGTWYLRKKRMEIMVKWILSREDTHEQREELLALFQNRLAEYEEYIKIRNEIRLKRYETQRLFNSSEERN